MFKKVFKYDFLAIIKMWALFAGICLFGSVIMGIGARIQSSGVGSYMLSSVLTMLGTLALYSLPVATIVLYVKNYVGTLFSHRGYLTFMLPVQRTTLYWSKVLAAVVYEAMSSLVLLVAISIATSIGSSSVSIVTEVAKSTANNWFSSSSPLEIFISLNITALIGYGVVVGIFELVTGFRLAVVPGGGKKIALTIVAIVVTAEIVFVLLIITLLEDIFTIGIAEDLVAEGLRSFYNVTTLFTVLLGVATFDVICMLRSLYLIRHRLNLR